MNRKERRASQRRSSHPAASSAPPAWDKAFTTEGQLAKARLHHQQHQPELAREAAERILAREPSHVPALNLLGLIYQESGRHRLAAKALAKAVAADALNAACHYNLAVSYQALERPDDAAVHFKAAIGLGMSRKNIEDFIFQNSAVTACIDRIDHTWPLPAKTDEILCGQDLDAIANDIFLRCALEKVLIRSEPLEKFLTVLRSALLVLAESHLGGGETDARTGLLCAVAQQCFINEYVYALSDDEARRSQRLREALLQRSAGGETIPPLLLATVAAYHPLHRLPGAPALAERKWPQALTGLVRQQLHEPLLEVADLAAIPALTPVDDDVSLKVMRQYEENPYPRWTINPYAAVADEFDPATGGAGAVKDILIAGCGTGQHAFQIAHYFPDARVLAIDISRPSLAYARRKSREEGLRNIDYAQADILKLGGLGRSFDRIEAVGVLHHLAKPQAGLDVLVSLLRPGGELRIGLYSEAARTVIAEIRDFIAERGYGASADDIRKCRQNILRDADRRRWNTMLKITDFYSMSDCRDMLFNVMEHRFTIPKIKSLLHGQPLTFQGFELEARLMEKFQARDLDAGALTDLDKWLTFEADYPDTFRNMYVFTVCKDL